MQKYTPRVWMCEFNKLQCLAKADTIQSEPMRGFVRVKNVASRGEYPLYYLTLFGGGCRTAKKSAPDIGVMRVDAASNIARAKPKLWPVRDVGQDFAGCGCFSCCL
jgi:hypothetical protein